MTRTLLLIAIVGFGWTSTLSAQQYRRASRDPDNVKNKIYDKKGKFELDLPDFGLILNQSFLTTFLVRGGITYYMSEEWGINFEAAMGLNQDKSERECLETFYNDPVDQIDDAECGDSGTIDNANSNNDYQSPRVANYGPAYMPIREIRYIAAANAMWHPIYGKQLFFMSATSYFDLFLIMGGGVVLSDYYAQRDQLENGNQPRAKFDEDPNQNQLEPNRGADTNETDSYGEAGRPVAESQTHPFVNLGIGQRYHFAKRFHIRFEFRNMTLLGTPTGFENLFAIMTGFGVRF